MKKDGLAIAILDKAAASDEGSVDDEGNEQEVVAEGLILAIKEGDTAAVVNSLEELVRSIIEGE
jgi:hypothetical protein